MIQSNKAVKWQQEHYETYDSIQTDRQRERERERGETIKWDSW